jgi:hypothetical protein
MGGLGDEDERIIPLSIEGVISIDVNDTGNSNRALIGEIYAVTHISTSAEQWVLVSDNTNRLLYSEMQNMFGDEFNYKKIGSMTQKLEGVLSGGYSYKFNKKLRELLDRKIQDPDYDVEFVIVVALFSSRQIGSEDSITFISKDTLKYQIANRSLTSLPT